MNEKRKEKETVSQQICFATIEMVIDAYRNNFKLIQGYRMAKVVSEVPRTVKLKSDRFNCLSRNLRNYVSLKI